MGNKQCLCVCVNVVQIKSFAHFAVTFTLKPAAATHFHRHQRVYGFISIFEFIQNSTSSIVYAYGTYKHQRFTTHHGWPRTTIDKRCQLIRITSNKMSAGAMDNMKQRMQWLTATAACLKHTQGGGIRRWASSRFSFTYIIYYRWVCFGIMVGGRTLSVYGRNFSTQILCFLGLWSSFVFAEYFSFFQVLVYVWN